MKLLQKLCLVVVLAVLTWSQGNAMYNRSGPLTPRSHNKLMRDATAAVRPTSRDQNYYIPLLGYTAPKGDKTKRKKSKKPGTSSLEAEIASLGLNDSADELAEEKEEMVTLLDEKEKQQVFEETYAKVLVWEHLDDECYKNPGKLVDCLHKYSQKRKLELFTQDFCIWLCKQRSPSEDMVRDALKSIKDEDDLNTPLHIAAVRGDDVVCSFLLSMGADLMARNIWRETPLYKAAFAGHKSTCKLLIQAFGDLDNAYMLALGKRFGSLRCDVFSAYDEAFNELTREMPRKNVTKIKSNLN